MSASSGGLRVFRRFFIPLFALTQLAAISAQNVISIPQHASATVWVYSEEVPGNEKYSPREALESTARFVLSGMIFGWRFEYTPSDRARNVQEYFSLEPLAEISADNPCFSLSHIQSLPPRLYARAEFTYDQAAAHSFRHWNSIVFKTGKGRGFGERKNETAGILQAYTNAIKQAIREYARTIEKNKPKEIRGNVKLREEPRLFADQGRIIAETDVLLDITAIIPYTVF